MKMCSKTGTFKKNKFDGVIKDTTGENLTVGVDFSVIEPSIITDNSVLTQNVVSIGIHTLEPGDPVLIIGSDGQQRNNIIQSVGETTIGLKDNIKPSSSITVDVKIPFYTITINLDENDDLYYFSDNEALIISETYLNLYISYSELHSEWNGVSRDVIMESLNARALEAVLADFSFNPEFYKSIDISQIKQLIILKMLTKIMNGDDRAAALIQYANYKNSMQVIVKKNNTEDLVTPDITSENTVISTGYDIRTGAS